jgi:hypothetical protein
MWGFILMHMIYARINHLQEEKIMKKHLSIFSISFYLLTVIFLFQGCGGGGGDSSGQSVTPTTENITGTYTLRDFTVKFSNGEVRTGDDYSSFSGAMKLGPQSISQSFRVGDTPIAISGTYTITYTNGTSAGIFHVTQSTGSYDMAFSTSRNQLSTYYVDSNYEEWDSWEKTSNSFESVTNETIEKQNDKSLFGTIGKIIIEKNVIGN